MGTQRLRFIKARKKRSGLGLARILIQRLRFAESDYWAENRSPERHVDPGEGRLFSIYQIVKRIETCGNSRHRKITLKVPLQNKVKHENLVFFKNKKYRKYKEKAVQNPIVMLPH